MQRAGPREEKMLASGAKGGAGKVLSVDFLGPKAVLMNRLLPTTRALPEKRGDLKMGRESGQKQAQQESSWRLQR